MNDNSSAGGTVAPSPHTPQPPRLLDQLRQAVLDHGHSEAAATAFAAWARQYILFHGKQPICWRDARWLGGYLTNSALLLGCAELLALAALLGPERAGAMLRPALMLLLVLNVIPLCLVSANLRPALSRVYTPRQLGRLAALCVGGGTLVPLALLLAGGRPLPVLAAVLLLLLGGLALRFVAVRLPHACA